jgi:biotin carboxyl carrier protein
MRFMARHDGTDRPIEVERHGSGYRVKLGERWIEADLVEAGPYLRSLRLEDGTQLAVIHHRDGNMHEVTLASSTIHVEIIDPLALRRRRSGEDETSGGGIVRALMPGRIVKVFVQPGESVRKGAALMILEAMKMENEIHAPADGVVDQLFVESGQTVESGAELVHIATG